MWGSSEDRTYLGKGKDRPTHIETYDSENSDKREDSTLKVRGERTEVRNKIRANKIYPTNFQKIVLDALNSTTVGKVILQETGPWGIDNLRL
jgi:1,4-dihydroxy-2-naphthoyl-CoA synthase